MSNEEHRNDAMRRTVIKAMAAAAGGLPAIARAQAPAGRGAALPKVLRYAFQVGETGMDPVQLVDLYSRILTAHLFEGLYDYDHLARPYLIRPATADGPPEISDDFRTWTVRVKPGILFQDDPASRASRAS